jgi:predicted small lipoprotein YifL
MKTILLSVLFSLTLASFSLSACGKGKALEPVKPTESSSSN